MDGARAKDELSSRRRALGAMTGPEFDVFLSHSSRDKLAVEQLARRLLQSAYVKPWLDKWNLIPGEPWQPALEAALSKCGTCAVIVGPNGTGLWQSEEMRAAITRRVTQTTGSFRVIPVLLPGANSNALDDLPFLTASTYVQFNHTLQEDEPFRMLVAGIRGVEPGPSNLLPDERSAKNTWALVLSGTIDELDKPRAEAIIEHLRNISGDLTLTLKKIEVGSIRLQLESTPEAHEWISYLIGTGQLREVLGFPIEAAAPAEAESLPPLAGEPSASRSARSSSFIATQQDSFLNKLRNDRTYLTIYLMSGVKLSGRIKSFDKYSVILEMDKQEQLIFKHAIHNVVVQRSGYSQSWQTLASVATSPDTLSSHDYDVDRES